MVNPAADQDLLLSPNSGGPRWDWLRNNKKKVGILAIVAALLLLLIIALAVALPNHSSDPGPTPTTARTTTTTFPTTTTTTPTTTPTTTSTTTTTPKTTSPTTTTPTTTSTTTTESPETTTFYPTLKPLPVDAVHIPPVRLLIQMDMHPNFTEIFCDFDSSDSKPVFKYNVTVEGGHTYASPGADSRDLAQKSVAMVANEALFDLHYPADVPMPQPSFPCVDEIDD